MGLYPYSLGIEEGIELLLGLINDMFDRGEFPAQWRESLVIMIPKTGGGRGFRPISLISCVLKLMERMVLNRLRWLLESEMILPDHQFGFRNACSCADNLTVLNNSIRAAFVKNQYMVCLFLDKEGAFDNVIPGILIQDLRSLGVPAKMCWFIAHILLERSLTFVVEGERRSPCLSHRDTPQESMLSLTFFNIYLKDIARHILRQVLYNTLMTWLYSRLMRA